MYRRRRRSTTFSTHSRKKPTIVIKGFQSCPYFQKAVKLAKRKKKQGVVKKVTIKRYSSQTFFNRIAKSCPLVLFNGKKLRDGFTSLQKKLR